MPAVMNCLDEENTCVIGGTHFHFKGRQIKYFHDNKLAHTIGKLKSEDGFVVLPPELEDLAHLKEDMFKQVVTKDQLAIIEQKRIEGINNYCRRLRAQIYNATVSVQKDIDKAGYKYDARVEATDGDLHALKTLAKYQNSKLDGEQKKIDEFKELEKIVK